MMEREDKYVRFQDWRSPEPSVTSENIVSPRRHNVLRSFKERTDGVFAFLGNFFHSETSKRSMLDDRKSTPKILHPQGPFLQRWNKIFVLSCIFAVSVDPLFLYIPVINDQNSCWYLDRKLEITASVLRSVTDMFYIVHMLFQFWTGFITSSPTTFGRGVLVEDKYAIAKRYLSTYFLIDVCAVLPLPQVVILAVLPILQASAFMKAKNILMFIFICQYIPRLIRIRPLYLQITRSAGIITETAWAGAVFNLINYMLASHTDGSLDDRSSSSPGCCCICGGETVYSAVFEVDCTELVHIWKLGRSDRSVISPILDDICELSFSFESLVHVQFAGQPIRWLTTMLCTLALMWCHKIGWQNVLSLSSQPSG